MVVVTHSVPDGWPREGAPFTFVTDGIERAIEQAKELAGDKVVGVNGGTITGKCFDAQDLVERRDLARPRPRPARRRHPVLRPS